MSEESSLRLGEMSADMVAPIVAGDILEKIDNAIVDLLKDKSAEEVKLIAAKVFDYLASHKDEVIRLVDKYAEMEK